MNTDADVESDTDHGISSMGHGVSSTEYTYRTCKASTSKARGEAEYPEHLANTASGLHLEILSSQTVRTYVLKIGPQMAQDPCCPSMGFMMAK
jgi:hypothetical protein